MSKFDSKKVMPRYAFIAVIMTLVAISVLGKTLYIMTAKRAYWEEVADRVKVDSLKTQPMRGNILSCDGQLMASSLPQYNIYMDFKALREAKKDTLFCEKIDSICTGSTLSSLTARRPSSRSISWRVSSRTSATGPCGTDASTTARSQK